MMPGMKTPVREVLKAADNNHMVLNHKIAAAKGTMEINYTRAKESAKETSSFLILPFALRGSAPR